MGYYGFDIYYLILVLPAVIFAMWAQSKVNSTFNKYSRIGARRGITGAMAAQAVLRANGVFGVGIEHVSGNLTDHYDPRTNTIRLSDSVFSSSSVAAIGVAAHEAGHAVQYAANYGPIRIRQAIIPISQIGSSLSMPMILIGVILNSSTLLDLGILFFGLAALFQLVTLPVEFNASKRAVLALDQGNMLDDEELKGAKKTLTAAALTYVAALAVSLAQFLRLIIIFGGRGRDRD
ncbi:MAG: zinc metallopeptidase [Clostridia bacterium]|nr:zinc metallopeptidase [Clostridia bacterium]